MIDFDSTFRSRAIEDDMNEATKLSATTTKSTKHERRARPHERQKELRRMRRQVGFLQIDREKLNVEEIADQSPEPMTDNLYACSYNSATSEALENRFHFHNHIKYKARFLGELLSGICHERTKLGYQKKFGPRKRTQTLAWTLITLLLLLLSNCLTHLNRQSSSLIMPTQAKHIDDESSHTPADHTLSSSDEQGNSDTYTQIPPNEYGGGSGERPAYSTPSTQNGAQAIVLNQKRNKQRSALVQVSETELMSFSDFNVQQPAFSDLMRSWPPSTTKKTSQTFGSADKQQNKYSGASSSSRARPIHTHHIVTESSPFGASEIEQMELVSHLNENLDDTIVTADQQFERDQMPEPPTWINYLGELGDYIYAQLRQQLFAQSILADSFSSSKDRANSDNTTEQLRLSKKPKIETIDELLDDHYYEQYENSQVLYYGPQLVREGEVFEIGCYLPLNHKAEWTKSGQALAKVARSGSHKVIRQSEFLSAKQNYSLKIFEASINDSGNYRCDRMSRKYHKLVVAPAHTTTTQLYVIQQRLLSVINPKLVSAPHYARPTLIMDPSAKKINPNYLLASSGNGRQQSQYAASSRGGRKSSDILLPGYLIVENKPLVVNCNITDEFVLRRLRESPWFQLAWYKNGKQFRGSMAGFNHNHPSSNGLNTQLQSAPTSRNQQQQQRNQMPLQVSSSDAQIHLQAATSTSPLPAPPSSTQRVQFLQANGRQLYISSAQYSDAGEYFCSWFKLPARQQSAAGTEQGVVEPNESFSAGDDAQRQVLPEATIASTPLDAGHQVQLIVPAKLRPFKSTYHIRQGNQLRLTCMVQRSYPPAHIAWYVGNRLIDAEFLRDHAGQFRVLHLENQNQLVVSPISATGPSSDNGNEQRGQTDSDKRRIVEINPIPSSRQQMALTSNGRGQWIEYRELKDEKYAIETTEQQNRYMQMKLAQLTGATLYLTASPSSQTPGDQLVMPTSHDATLFSQASLSVLVVKSVDPVQHSSRYSCRATTRVNTDEMTTLIKVLESSTIVIRPSSGLATLIPSQPLHFECENVGNKKAQFKWFRTSSLGVETPIQPGDDDTIEIHNERITLHHPRYDQVGDYTCKVLDDNNQVNPKEYATVKVRTQPYIEDFDRETSHTGKSITITDGERLEITCKVHDTSSPINITWLRSSSPNDERSIMVPVPERTELCDGCDATTLPTVSGLSLRIEPEIIVEKINSHSKRLVIESVKHSHRSYYACIADNGVTEKTRKIVLVRVKDKLAALWPFLGIVAQFFVLFTIIYIWDTQRAYKELRASPKRAAGAESVPLTSG